MSPSDTGPQRRYTSGCSANQYRCRLTQSTLKKPVFFLDNGEGFKELKDSSHNRKVPNRATLLVLFTLGTIFVAEMVARAILWRTNYETVNYGHNPDGYGDLMPNQDGIWVILPHRPYHVVTNEVGLRNAGELSTNKAIPRILAIGDSYTFGPYVANEDTWPGWLERILNVRLYPETTVEVLNAGIGGYTITDEKAYLQEKGMAFNPDLVILGFFPNDISDLRKAQRTYLERPAPSVPAKGVRNQRLVPLIKLRSILRSQSALYNVAKLVKKRILLTLAEKLIAEEHDTGVGQDGRSLYRADARAISPIQYSSENQVYWQQYETHLRETIAMLDEAGIPLLLIAIPGPGQLVRYGYSDRPQRFLAQIVSETGTPYLDLLPIFKSEGDVQSLYLLQYDPSVPIDPTHPTVPEHRWLGNGHLSRYGYYVIANAIADWIVHKCQFGEQGCRGK